MRDKGQGVPPEAIGVEANEIKQGKLYVEVGSGGSPAFFISGKQLNPGDRYITVDHRPDEVRVSNDFGKEVFGEAFEALQGSGHKLPLADESVDEVIFNNVFGDERTSDREKLFLEAARVLKSGGQVVITEHITPTDFIKKIGMTQEEVQDYLVQHNVNLKVKKISASEADAQDYIGKKDSRLVKGAPIQIVLEK